jgi:type IV pilus assembly protein PilB
MPSSDLQPMDLTRRLVNSGVVSAAVAHQALQDAARVDTSLISYLLAKRLAPCGPLALVAAQAYGLPLLDLDAVDLASLPVSLVDQQLLLKHRLLPLWRRGQRLYVGVADPAHQQSLDDIRFHTALQVSPVLVEDDKLQRILDGWSRSAPQDAAGGLPDTVDDAPVVRYVNNILLDAVNVAASDIHFEPYETYYRIRFRLDGILYDQPPPAAEIAPRLASRLKVMAQLNIAEKRVPQDGRIRLTVSPHRTVDLRINTCPTLYGEKVVLRILEASAASLAVDELGLELQQQQQFLQAISRPQGMVLVTGPTGSGKTVTLYSVLNRLNKSEVNISTVEDPVEIQVAGINQVNINPKTGLTFAEALRAFLRQDPDILMVGEIRDLETAEIAIKAAQTGHLVMSTVHTNDASQTLMRLGYMGVSAFNLASSINLIVAQRLARRLCDQCKQVDELGTEALRDEGFSASELEAGILVYRAVGCPSCTNGYKGRIGIFEVMPISDAMGRLIVSGANAMQIRDQAKSEGVLDLRCAGLGKVKAGLTSLAEINRITKN